MEIVTALLIPLLGTMLGSAFVFFMKDDIPPRVQKALLGFASGVMVAASVWSLLLPSMEMGEGVWPAALGLLGGFALGFALMMVLDVVLGQVARGMKTA